MKYKELLQGLLEKSYTLGLLPYYYHNYNHSLFKKQSGTIRRMPRVKHELVRLSSYLSGPRMLLTAGFHGNETAGPLTVYHHLEEIFDYAKDKNVSLTIYPCINPWGFEANKRYNCFNESSNNDFLRYKIMEGKAEKIVDDLKDSKEYEAFIISSDPSLKVKLPFETHFLHDDLARVGYTSFKGSLDIHQDDFINEEGTYGYIMDKTEMFAPLAEKAGTIVPIFREKMIGSGQSSEMRTDKHGFIYRHDGTLTDFMYRMNCTYNAFVETTTKVPMEKAMAVNMVWIKGMIDLVTEKK